MTQAPGFAIGKRRRVALVAGGTGLVGRELEVLVESPGATPGSVIGTACRYTPVELPGDESCVRNFVRAIACQVADDRLLAQSIAI